MSLTVSPEAKSLFKHKFDGRPGCIRLAYDNEGCGCSLSGAIALWLIDEPETADNVIPSESGIPFVVNRYDAVYFDERLFITVSAFDKTSVRLSSDGQSYGSSIRIEDRRIGSKARV